MNTRRTFFKSLAKAAAIVALAPQLAFRVRPEVVDVAAIDRELQRQWVNAFFWGERLPCGYTEKVIEFRASLERYRKRDVELFKKMDEAFENP